MYIRKDILHKYVAGAHKKAETVVQPVALDLQLPPYCCVKNLIGETLSRRLNFRVEHIRTMRTTSRQLTS
jgi:hypothetical protein